MGSYFSLFSLVVLLERERELYRRVVGNVWKNGTWNLIGEML